MDISLAKIYKLVELEKNNPKVQLLLNNLDFFDNICNYLLDKNEISKYDFKQLSKLTNEEAFNISNQVLSSFSTKYPQMMNEYKNEGRLLITDESNKLMGSGSAYIDENDNKVKIRLGLHNDIFDPYLIVHEFMHSLNENNPRSIDRELLTEGFAIYSEYLLADFLEKNNINTLENTEILKLRLHTFYQKLRILKSYIHNIRELNTNKNELNLDNEQITIFDIGNFLSSIQYSFGNILSIILFKRNKDGLFNNEEYIKLNEEMKNSSDYSLFNRIFSNGLEFSEFVDSYEEACKFINKEEIHIK